MDVPPLVIDLRQLRSDAQSGRVSVQQLLDLIERQQQTIQRLQAERQRLSQRLAQYEPEAAKQTKTPATNTANANASYSVDAETKRRQKRKRPKKSPGRTPTEVKFADADRVQNFYPDGIPKRDCQLVRERAIWRIEDGKSIQPKGHEQADETWPHIRDVETIAARGESRFWACFYFAGR